MIGCFLSPARRPEVCVTCPGVIPFPFFGRVHVRGSLRERELREYNVITREGRQKMRAELVRIGNSRGVRIPKPLIQECGLGDTVELRVENNCLVISAARRPRQGWEEAFRVAGPAAPNELLLDTAEPNEFDRKEWQW
jgi:antitoxin MazE